MAAETPWTTLTIADNIGSDFRVGGGTLLCRYRRNGDGLVFVNFAFLWADDTRGDSAGDTWRFSLPNEFPSFYYDASGVLLPRIPNALGACDCYDASTTTTTRTHAFIGYQSAQWFLWFEGVTNTAPFTWATGDQLFATVVAEGLHT